MSKILLVFDNYTEMIQIETQLKRVGFDAVGVGSELSLSNQVIELNPSIIIAYGQGNRVNTLSVAKKLKEMVRWPGKVILIFPETMKPQPDDFLKMRMDMAIEAPPKIERVLQVIAKLHNLDEILLLEKLKNISAHDGQDHQLFKAQLHQSDNQVIKGPSGNPQQFSTILHEQQQSDDENGFELKKFDLRQDHSRFVKSKIRDEETSEKNHVKAFQIQDESESASGSQLDEKSQKTLGKPGKEDGASQILEFLAKQEEAKQKRKGARLHTPKPEITPLREIPSKADIGESNRQDADSIDTVHVNGSVPKSDRDIVHETNKALEDGGSRVEKYKNFLTNIAFTPQSTVQRKLTRRIQQDLMQGVSVQETENQDEHRREFTRALFHSRK